MAQVTMKNLCKEYPGGVVALKDFSLTIDDGEFVVLVGPSGCGKSTTLNMLAGLEEITSGEIYIGDRLVNFLPPKDRDIGMVFQNYALLPNLNVYDNIGLGLTIRHMDKKEKDRRIREAAKLLELEDLLKRKPKQLSGGQRQRVAIGRCIVRNPKIFLFDEPLSNLDAKLRTQMRKELIKLHHELNTTILYVTHDQVEAMTMGDRIVVMKDGVAQQIGTPEEVYDAPANLFVATFIGSPSMNIMDASFDFDTSEPCVRLDGGGTVSLGDNLSAVSASRYKSGDKVFLGVRPEKMWPADKGEQPLYQSRITLVEPLGSEKYIYYAYKDRNITVHDDSDRNFSREEAGFCFKAEDMVLFDYQTEIAIR